MTSDSRPSFQLSLEDAACRRLPGVETLSFLLADGSRCELRIALPLSYGKGGRRYPLLLVLDPAIGFGSALEMTRLMAETREIRECIVAMPVITPPAAQLSAVLDACAPRLRIEPGQVVLFGGAAAASPRGAEWLGASASAESALPTLVDALRRRWSTGRAYGSNVTPLRSPLMQHLLGLLRPLFAAWRARAAPSLESANPHLLRSERMARDFEIFISLPAGFDSARRYGALLVLDANIEFSTAAETAARMAAAGAIDDLIVIGVGVPRHEGKVEFGFRRFEEFSPPPPPSYDWRDDLGRIFRSLFAIRGQDARQRIGEAPAFYSFLTGELLPLLRASLPIDEARIGLLGHSAGGTFVGYALHQLDSPFSRYFAVSPGIGISDRWLMQQPATRPLASRARQVVLTLGSEEMENLFNRIAGIHETPDYAERLRAQAPNIEISYRCFPAQTHSSVYPAAVAYSLTIGYARMAADAPYNPAPAASFA